MPDEGEVLELLEQLLDSGMSPEELCRDRPGLLPEVQRRWKEFQLIDAELAALLPESTTGPALDSKPLPTIDGLPQIPGYRIESILGRGGMGVVYKAHHLALKRTVALKMLAAGRANSVERARFKGEAEAVARLQHPNVVQIHEIGEVDGQPFLALEFVEGESLANRLDGGPLPPRDAASLLELLAEAMHLAHSRNLVHRDLKPANVLLAGTADTPIGQCQPKVTDFGLARQLDADSSQTFVGVVIGTPSYMAPEQAEGGAHAAGPAADVYALGAVLYECLTGQPPFRGATPLETLEQVRTREPAAPSSRNRRVPRDLETICLKCLRKEPERRYSSSRELAEDLERFLRGEPVAARPIGMVERVLRWIRRRPAGAALLGTALTLVVLAIGGGVWLVKQRANRRAELQSDVTMAIAQAVSLRKRFHFNEAHELLEEAALRLQRSGADDLRRQVDQERADLDLAENLDAARLLAASPVGGTFDTAGAHSLYAESLYEKTLAKAGLGEPGGDSEASAARVRESTLSAELVAALDDWASITPDYGRRAWLLTVARGADPDLSRDRLRQPKLWDDGPGLTKLVKELRVAELSPQLTTALGRVLLKTDGEAVPLLSAAQARNPQEFWLNFELGWALFVSKRSDEALGFYRAALALRPNASPTYNGVAVTLGALGRWDDAIDFYKQALNIDPNFAMVHNNLGLALWAKDRQDQAIRHYRAAIRLDPKASAMAHNNLGLALLEKGRRDEAIGHFQESIRIDPKASATAHNNLGIALCAMGRQEEAIRHYQEVIRLDPKVSPLAHIYLGLALYAKGRQDEAIRHYQEAIRLDPKASATAHNNLGLALRDKGRLDEAISHYEKSIQLDPNASGLAHNNLGLALQAKGRLEEAINHYQEAIRLDPKTAAMAHNNLGLALRDKGRLGEAIAHYQESIRLDPKASAMAHNNLGLALGEKGRPQEAIGDFQQAIRLEPNLTVAARNLYSCMYATARAALRNSVGHDSQEIGRPGGPERAGLRRQALGWLRADLDLRPQLLKTCKLTDLHTLPGWPLTGWQTDATLASVREKAQLRKLPDAEREEWQHVWADVAALIPADPLDQGTALAGRRKWSHAGECYERTLKREAAESGHFWFEYAAVRFLSGDRKGYERACAHMVERCGKSADLRAYHVARACTLAAGSVADLSQPARLAKPELQAAAGQFWSLTEQGALLYRAGQFGQARALFEQSLRASAKPGEAVLNWLWLSLAEQRLGKTGEAHRWLAKAIAWLDQYRDGVPARAEDELGLHLHNWLEANVLRHEAEAIVQPAEPR